MTKTGVEIYEVDRPSKYGGDFSTREKISGKDLVEEIETAFADMANREFELKESKEIITSAAIYFKKDPSVRNDPVAFIKALEHFLTKEIAPLISKYGLQTDPGPRMLSAMKEYLDGLKNSPGLQVGFAQERAQERAQEKASELLGKIDTKVVDDFITSEKGRQSKISSAQQSIKDTRKSLFAHFGHGYETKLALAQQLKNALDINRDDRKSMSPEQKLQSIQQELAVIQAKADKRIQKKDPFVKLLAQTIEKIQPEIPQIKASHKHHS
ncbi:MAG: hypothetical protein JSR17_12445 [Proteobacteria bacterium]|nr:hypothetical protein [Pseudomonadota bacterium]